MNHTSQQSILRAIYCSSFGLFGFAPLLADDSVLVQEYTGDNKYIEITSAEELPQKIVQKSGIWKQDKVYSDLAYQVGFHIRTGTTIDMNTELPLAGWNTSHVIGAHGADTVVRYSGNWQGDGGNSFPNLVLSEGARFVITPEAHIDYVLQDSFYTRQLWAYGDGTGTIEIEEGFLADRTKDGTVEDAFGTIRLNGVHLVTHHSRNLPFNSRPDGRGAIYPNGHIVWEGQAGSVWTVATNAQTYPAQLDFHSDGTINCQAHLVHNGEKRVTAAAMVGGIFTSTGAFRTCQPGVTITKTGPAMLSLEGQQGYYPDSTLNIQEGTLKMSTNPGNGYRYDSNAGPYLSISAHNASHVLLAAETSQLEAITLHDEAELFSFSDSNIATSKGIMITENAKIHAQGSYRGDITAQGTWSARATATIDGTVTLAGPLEIALNLHRKKQPPESIVLVNATKIDGRFSSVADGDTVTFSGGRAQGTIRYHQSRIEIVDITLKEKPKKKKKNK